MKPIKKKKELIILKKLNWNLIVKDLLEGLFLSQQELAKFCKVSQQVVSFWKNGHRNPGIFAKQILLKLSQKKNINLSKYETDSERDLVLNYFKKNKGKEFIRMLNLYNKMSKISKIKFLKYVNNLLRLQP